MTPIARTPPIGPQLRAAAAQGARGMGLDLSAMTLTADGFVLKEEAGPALRASCYGGKA